MGLDHLEVFSLSNEGRDIRRVFRSMALTNAAGLAIGSATQEEFFVVFFPVLIVCCRIRDVELHVY